MRATGRTTLARLMAAMVLMGPSVIDAQRVEEGIVVLYDFKEGADSVVHDRGPGDPLDLVIDDFDLDNLVEWIPDGGLAINIGTGPGGGGGARPIQSTEPALKIFDAIAGPGGSSEYTLEAWVRSEIPDLQSNISRIATYSSNPSRRNFTLGTVTTGDQYVNRLRTSATGNNGAGGPGQLITSGRTVRAGQRQHVVFTRDDAGEETLYVDGQIVAGPRIVAEFDGLAIWDPSYFLGLGNELTRNRKFNGTFHLVAIYNEALTAEDVTTNYNAASPEERVDVGLLSLYDFKEGDGPDVQDSGPGDPLDLVIDDFDLDNLVEWVDDGLAMNLETGTGQDGGALIQSVEPATKIYEAVAGPDGTNAITVEVWVTPELDDLQVNISRMVTISVNPSNRNITLGTTGDGANFVNRLRNPETGNNGSGGPGQLIASPVVAVRAGELQHVVFTRTVEGEESIYVDNKRMANRIVAEFDDLSSWDPTYHFALGDEFVDGGRKFNGEYHLIALYDFALTAEEVEQNFRAGLGGEPEGPLFVRGDANADGSFNISDGSFVLNALFAGRTLPTCQDSADANTDGAVDIADGVYMLNALFGGGASPGPPFPDCAAGEVVLGCESFAGCQ